MGNCVSTSTEVVVDGPSNQNATTQDKDSARSINVGGKLIPISDRVFATRVRNIFGSHLSLAGNFVIPIIPKSESEYEAIRKALNTNFIFTQGSTEELDSLIQAFERFSVDDGVMVIQQGEVGDYFYIIKEGIVEYIVDGKAMGVGKAGTTFGELALLYSSARSATCLSKGKCEFWRLEKIAFRQTLATSKMQQIEATRAVLKEVYFLRDLGYEHLLSIVNALTEEKHDANTTIFEKGEEGDKFYIIKKGSVFLSNIGSKGSSRYVDHTLEKGDYFGERALMTGGPRAAKVSSKTKVTLLSMTRVKFQITLGSLEKLMATSQICNDLMGVPFIAEAKLTKREVHDLVSIMKTELYCQGETIMKLGDTSRQAFFFITSGEVIQKDQFDNILKYRSHEYFGSNNMKPWDKNLLNEFTYTVTESCEMLVLTIENVKTMYPILGETLFGSDNILKKSFTMSSIKKHRLLGAGTFGKVWLVEDIDDNSPYALKQQEKGTILEYNVLKGVFREKTIMETINSPFVIKIIGAFQTDTSVCTITKIYPGGELFSIIHSETGDGMDEKTAAFYSASILEGLSFLHKKKILFRDMKPENILINEKGYTVIIDLGFAKVVYDKTYTLCGTPMYLAPECILYKGHDRAADLWGFGIITYEIITGITPFHSPGIDQVTLLKRICRGEYAYEAIAVSPDAEDLIESFLRIRPDERLGMQANCEADIHRHKWFEDIDWNKLKTQEMKAPWVPKLENAFDSSHFNNWDHLNNEDVLAPLSEEDQELFRDF